MYLVVRDSRSLSGSQYCAEVDSRIAFERVVRYHSGKRGNILETHYRYSLAAIDRVNAKKTPLSIAEPAAMTKETFATEQEEVTTQGPR